MQTHLADFIRDTPAGREADAILRACVHCGFCTATCPTYQLLGDELDGPRGRIYLIKQALEGGDVTAKTQLHLDRCLTCRSCETTCPSGVRYGRLVDIGRQVRRRSRRPRAGRCGEALGAAPRPAVEIAVRRGADARPLARSRSCRARSRASIPLTRERRAWPRAAPRAHGADRARLRAAVARAEHRRGDRARARSHRASRRLPSKAAAAAARCRITCPSTTKRARSRGATSTRGGRTSSAAPRRSS